MIGRGHVEAPAVPVIVGGGGAGCTGEFAL